MLIFEGPQGGGKSSAIQALCARPEWFGDDLPLHADTQRQMEATAGRWIVEAGELRGMSAADVNGLKSFLSRTVDRARQAYGRKPTVAPRQFVIIGTTNAEDGYLRDSTGNRRFWPVRVGRFDVEAVARDRDQLWAEAATLERQGRSIRLAPELWHAAAAQQASREAIDTFEMRLVEALGDRVGVIRTEDIWRILGIASTESTADQQRRLAAVLQKLGWSRTRRRFGGDRVYAYQRGDSDEWISGGTP